MLTRTPRTPAPSDSPPDSPYLTADDADEPPVLTTRAVTGALAAVVTFVLALAMLLVTPPYAVHSPGPTVDTTGEVAEEPLITVEGAETYPTDGELLLTTVSTRGGPGFPVSTGQVITGWLSSDVTVVPRELAYDPERSRDEISEESTMQMASSQANASAAALTELGYEVPVTLRVSGTMDSGASAGILEPEDELEWIETDAGRAELTSFEVLTGALAHTPPDSEITLGVRRGQDEEELTLRTQASGSGGSVIGVYLVTEADLPVDISFAIENIGGPSGGLMLSLGIIDLLTPGDLTGGAVVAGTGTITVTGDVGPIGGIAQKLVGAREAGAEWFLAPVANCAEVVGRVPDGLGVVAVPTLADAVSALEAIAEGETGGLPACAGY